MALLDARIDEINLGFGCDKAPNRIILGRGTHFIVELWQCPFEKLADANEVSKAFQLAARFDSDITIKVHQFEPYGVSGSVSGDNLQVIIHTWPENSYAALDIFTQDKEYANRILETIKESLCAKYSFLTEVSRGLHLEKDT
jgi:S-adenosylmethionine/arginine decarboxylase-like enzyme